MPSISSLLHFRKRSPQQTMPDLPLSSSPTSYAMELPATDSQSVFSEKKSFRSSTDGSSDYPSFSYCQYPDETFRPHFTRRQATLVSICGAIGTGLFLGSGQPLIDAGPLGILLGYLTMSSVVYGMVVSSAEMVAAFPSCRGTVGLADRFVDPALGFAMGWNAWYHWGIVIPAQISSATSVIKFWKPASRLVVLWPFLFIMFISVPILLGRHFGDIQSVFAIVKLSAVALLLILSVVLDAHATEIHHGPSTYWDPPFSQYLNIPGAWGRFLGFWAVFMQAAFSFFGTEIPSVIAGEIRNAPNVISDISRRVWIRMTFLYFVSIIIVGTVVPRSAVVPPKIDPSNPNSPTSGAPWAKSPFLVALIRAGASYNWATNLAVALIMTSAASAASTEIFLSTRYLFYLAKAGHAPSVFAKVWPNTERAKKDGDVVPWVGVLITVGFSSLSFMAMRPYENVAGTPEKVFSWISSMSSSAYLQSWVGTLFTYVRFWRGTKVQKSMYEYEIKLIERNRAWGQPFWAIYSLVMCCLILLFNGWSLFNTKNGRWVIFVTPDSPPFPKDQVMKFVTNYLPLPTLILLLFGYKFIKQSAMVRANGMDFRGVCDPDNHFADWKEEKPPTTFWGKVWFFLVC